MDTVILAHLLVKHDAKGKGIGSENMNRNSSPSMQCKSGRNPFFDPKVLMFFVMSDPSLKPATLFPFKVSVWLPVIIHVLFDLKIFPHKNQPHHGVFPWLFLWLKGYPLKKRFIRGRNSPWLWNHAAEPCVSGNLAPAPGSKNRDAICQAETGDTAMPRNFMTDGGMTWESHGNVIGNWSSINGNMMGFHEYDD